MEIKENGKVPTITIKRFYLPIITDKCPSCGKEVVNDDYLSYPEFNEKNEIFFDCHDCNEEWKKEIKLNVNIKEVN